MPFRRVVQVVTQGIIKYMPTLDYPGMSPITSLVSAPSPVPSQRRGFAKEETRLAEIKRLIPRVENLGYSLPTTITVSHARLLNEVYDLVKVNPALIAKPECSVERQFLYSLTQKEQKELELIKNLLKEYSFDFFNKIIKANLMDEFLACDDVEEVAALMMLTGEVELIIKHAEVASIIVTFYQTYKDKLPNFSTSPLWNTLKNNMLEAPDILWAVIALTDTTKEFELIITHANVAPSIVTFYHTHKASLPDFPNSILWKTLKENMSTAEEILSSYQERYHPRFNPKRNDLSVVAALFGGMALSLFIPPTKEEHITHEEQPLQLKS